MGWDGMRSGVVGVVLRPGGLGGDWGGPREAGYGFLGVLAGAAGATSTVPVVLICL